MCRKITLLILSLPLCFYCGCSVNPITGEKQLMLIAPEQDLAIGKKYAPEVEKQLGGRIDNERLQAYIDSVGQKIAHISHRPDWDYHFTAVNDKSLNALALPGGYIYITKGMLRKLTTEAQLAGILAHETTHVVARHSAASMSKEIGIDILLSAVTSEETSRGVMVATDVARQIMSLQYSKKDEREADLGGMSYMVRAGYNPYGMVETMQILKDESKHEPIEFFSTHPAPENRMAYLNQRIQSDYPELAGLKIGEDDYRREVLEKLGD